VQHQHFSVDYRPYEPGPERNARQDVERYLLQSVPYTTYTQS
jgi:hypothetical protein